MPHHSACAVIWLVWSTAAFAVPGHVCLQQPVLPSDVSFLQHPLLALAGSARVCPCVLQHTVLPLNVFVIEKTVLHLDVCLFSGKLVLYLDVSGLFYSSLAAPGRGCSTAALPPLEVAVLQQPCRPWTWLFYSSLAAPGRGCSTAALPPLDVAVLQQPCRPWTDVSLLQQSVLSQEMSGLQQLVLHLDVSVQQQPALCQEVNGHQYSSLCCTCSVRLQELLRCV